MFTIRNLVEQYTTKKANYLQKSYVEIINETSLCIIFYTQNGTRIFLDMHPEMQYTQKPEYNYERPNKKNVFRKFVFEVISGDNIVLTKGIDFEPWTINEHLKYIINAPISEKKFNEFIMDNGGINTKKLTEDINHSWNLTA